MEYFEGESSPEKSTRHGRSSRNYPVDVEVSLNEEIVTSSSPTRRSTRLSRTYNKDQEEVEMSVQEASLGVSKNEAQKSTPTARRSAKKKKGESNIRPSTQLRPRLEEGRPDTSPYNRRQQRASESAEVSPRRSLRSRNGR